MGPLRGPIIRSYVFWRYMIFRQMQICELPFMLNVESGNYDVAINDDVISIHISNEMYAASKQGSTTPFML